MGPGVTLHWSPREPPLTPAGMVALGPAAAQLAHRLRRLDDAVLSRLRGVFGDDVIALLGPHDWLPWTDGAVYVGEALPGLLLPTTIAPGVPEALLLAALQRKFPQLRLPVVCLPERAFSAGGAAPLTAFAIERLLCENGWK